MVIQHDDYHDYISGYHDLVPAYPQVMKLNNMFYVDVKK